MYSVLLFNACHRRRPLTDRFLNSVVQDGVVGLVDALAHLHSASFDGELEDITYNTVLSLFAVILLVEECISVLGSF